MSVVKDCRRSSWEAWQYTGDEHWIACVLGGKLVTDFKNGLSVGPRVASVTRDRPRFHGPSILRRGVSAQQASVGGATCTSPAPSGSRSLRGGALRRQHSVHPPRAWIGDVTPGSAASEHARLRGPTSRVSDTSRLAAPEPAFIPGRRGAGPVGGATC